MFYLGACWAILPSSWPISLPSWCERRVIFKQRTTLQPFARFLEIGAVKTSKTSQNTWFGIGSENERHSAPFACFASKIASRPQATLTWNLKIELKRGTVVKNRFSATIYPKMAPRWLQSGSETAPRWPKMFQDGLGMAQDGPRMVCVGSENVHCLSLPKFFK